MSCILTSFLEEIQKVSYTKCNDINDNNSHLY